MIMTHTLQICYYTLLLGVCLIIPQHDNIAQSRVALVHRAPSGDKLNQINQSSQLLVQVLDQLERDYRIRFAFQADDIKDKVVNSDPFLENAAKPTLESILKTVLDPLNLTFKRSQVDNYYIIRRKETQPSVNKLQSVIPHSATGTETIPRSRTQRIRVIEQTISGKVIDQSTNESLPGVNILAKGTTTGTVTDIDGNYRLTVADEATTLVFSSIGYVTVEEAINGRNTIDLSLAPDVQSLEEVVVIGYGTQEKRDLTGAVSSVSSEEIREVAVPGFDRAIAGKVSGVNITSSNAAPGGGNSILVRGYSSLSADSDPLIVLDGFPLNDGFSKDENPLNAINPNDIESIDVLKDASATAIYGARAANGVIIITTKSGSYGGGKPRIEFNANYGFSNIINQIEMLNREEYLQYMTDTRDQAYLNRDPNRWVGDPEVGRWSRDDDPETRYQNWVDVGQIGNPLKERWIYLTPEFRAYADSVPFYNWQDEILRTGINQNYQLSVSGGTDNLSYRLSGNYYDEEGIYPNTGFERYTARLNLEVKPTDRLTVGMRLNPSVRTIRKPGDMEGSVSNVNNAGSMNQLIGLVPIYQPYDENGDLVYWGDNSEYNPLWDPIFDFNVEAANNPYSLLQVQRDTRLFRNIGSIYGEYEFIDGLTYRLALNTDLQQRRNEQFIPSFVHERNQPFQEFASGQYDTRLNFFWNVQNLLQYTKDIDKHSFTVLAGYEANRSETESSNLEKRNYALDKFGTLNLAQEVEDPLNDVKSNRRTTSFIGMFGRVNYVYDNRYMLTASIRRDGSSKFGSDSKWGVFPSASVGWRITEEPFMPNLGPVNNIKLRAGYGQTGNSSIGDYRFVGTLNTGTAVFGEGGTYANQVGFFEGNLPYAGLSWETVTELNLGVDVGLLKDRIQLTTEVYDRTTTNLLFDEQIPWTTSFSSSQTNAGEMKTRGFEFSVTSRNLVSGKFRWTTTANLFWYRSILTDNNSNNPFLSGKNSRSYVDKTVGAFWGYHDIGIYQTYEEIKTNPTYENATNRDPVRQAHRMPGPGWLRRDDVNKDGVIDNRDQTIIGTPEPRFSYGMTNNISYRGFDLSVHIVGIQGRKVWNTGLSKRIYEYDAAGRTNTTQDNFANYWRPGKTDATYPVPSRKDGSPGRTLLWDASFLNISNVTFGYTLPRTLTERIGAQTLRAYVAVQNALYFTQYKGFNPEVNTNAGDDDDPVTLNQGIDDGAYPLTRTVSLGITLGF